MSSPQEKTPARTRKFSVEPEVDTAMMRRIVDELPFFVYLIGPTTQDNSTHDEYKKKLFKSVADDLTGSNVARSKPKWSARDVQDKCDWLVRVSSDVSHRAHTKLGDDLKALTAVYSNASVENLRGCLDRAYNTRKDRYGPTGVTYDDMLLDAVSRTLGASCRSIDAVWDGAAAYMNRETRTELFSSTSCENRVVKLMAASDDTKRYSTIRLTPRQNKRLNEIDDPLSQFESNASDHSSDASGNSSDSNDEEAHAPREPETTESQDGDGGSGDDTSAGEDSSDRVDEPVPPADTQEHGPAQGDEDATMEECGDSETLTPQRRGRGKDEDTKGDVDEPPGKRQRADDGGLKSSLVRSDFAPDSLELNDDASVSAAVEDTSVFNSGRIVPWDEIFRETAKFLDEESCEDLTSALERVCKALADVLRLESANAVLKLRSEGEKWIKDDLKLLQQDIKMTLELAPWSALSNREDAELTSLLEQAQGPPCRATTTAAKNAIDGIQRAFASCIDHKAEVAESVRRVDVEAIHVDVDVLTKRIDARIEERRADTTQCQRDKVDVDTQVSDIESALEEELTLRVQELIKAGKDERSARLEAIMAFSSSPVAQDLNQKRDKLQSHHSTAHQSAKKATAWLVFMEKLSALHQLVLPIVQSRLKQSTIRFQEEIFYAELAVEEQLTEYASKLSPALRPYIRVHVGRIEDAEMALAALRPKEAEFETNGDRLKRAPHEEDKNLSISAIEAVVSGHMKLWTGKDGLFSQKVLDKVAAAYDHLPGESNPEAHKLVNQWANLIRSLRPAAKFVVSTPPPVDRNDPNRDGQQFQQAHEESIVAATGHHFESASNGGVVIDQGREMVNADAEPTPSLEQHQESAQGSGSLWSLGGLWGG